MRPVRLNAGAAEFRFVVLTEKDGKDISGDTCEVALVPVDRDPLDADFETPDSDVAQTVKSKRVLGKLIDDPAESPSGEYYLWGRITDNPEIVPLRGTVVVVVVA